MLCVSTHGRFTEDRYVTAFKNIWREFFNIHDCRLTLLGPISVKTTFTNKWQNIITLQKNGKSIKVWQDCTIEHTVLSAHHQCLPFYELWLVAVRVIFLQHMLWSFTAAVSSSITTPNNNQTICHLMMLWGPLVDPSYKDSWFWACFVVAVTSVFKVWLHANPPAVQGHIPELNCWTDTFFFFALSFTL